MQYLLGWKDLKNLIAFDLVCHLGTLLAIIILLRKDIWEFIKTPRMWSFIVLALLPLLIMYPFLSQIKEVYNRPDLLGWFFLLTAILLLLGECASSMRKPTQKKKYSHSIIVGFFQVIALFPGVSRSGATISAGRLLAWDFSAAVRFSFLLALPTILGGSLLEIRHLVKEPMSSVVSLFSYFGGFVMSFAIGFLCLNWLLKQKSKHPFIVFAVYSLLLGILCLSFI